MENTIFEHITLEMIIAFTLGILSLFLYAWKTKNDNISNKEIAKYMILNIPNILFHIISSIMVFLGLHELGELIIKNYIPFLDGNSTYQYSLASLTGMFGSVFVVYILEKIKKIKNNLFNK